MAIQHQGTTGGGGIIQEVNATSLAARVILYDFAGNPVVVANRSAVAETTGGNIIAGKDYKLARTVRLGSTGAIQVAGDGSFLLADTFEGTVRDLNQWIETLTTMASAQAVATGLTLNSASTTTTTTGILESSHRQMPVIGRTGLVFRAHLRVLGATNCVEEWGFSDQASATAAGHSNGAFFRRDAAGSMQPVLAFNAVETQGTVMTGPTTTEYAWYEILLEDGRATFQVLSAAGALISSQVMELGSSAGGPGSATQARMFSVTHLPVFFRVFNTGAAGTAPQIIVNQASVHLIDGWSTRDHGMQQSGMGLNSLTSPTLHTQLANYANSAAPTTRSLTNTAAAETTLGGLLRVNSIVGAATDLIMFGWQNPSPYTFYVMGITIPPPINEVVAVATTANLIHYFVAFNSSAVSLATAAPYSPMRVALAGWHTAAIALAVNLPFSGSNIEWAPQTPMAVQPGRFFHIGCRMLTGAATATETFQWAGVAVDGIFE